jgi:hypothetical protein
LAPYACAGVAGSAAKAVEAVTAAITDTVARRAAEPAARSHANLDMNLLLNFACADVPMLDRLFWLSSAFISSREVVSPNHGLTIGESRRIAQDIFNFFETKKR